MTPLLLLAACVAAVLTAAATVFLAVVWLDRQTRRNEALRTTRWLAPFALDTDLLFETDNESQIRTHARTGRPPRTRATILRQARDRAPRVTRHHDLACLSPATLQAELTRLFEA